MASPLKFVSALLSHTIQVFLKYKPSLLVAVPSQAGSDVECFSFNSNASELELESVEYVPGSVSNHLVQNTIMVRLTATLPLFLTNEIKGAVSLHFSKIYFNCAFLLQFKKPCLY